MLEASQVRRACAASCSSWQSTPARRRVSRAVDGPPGRLVIVPAPSPRARAHDRTERAFLWAAFGALWVVHAIVAVGLLAAFVVLPIEASWYVALPLMVFLSFFSSNQPRCELTNLENRLRRRLGLATIDRFVPHYLRTIGRHLAPSRNRVPLT
jgi:hypothetical protein